MSDQTTAPAQEPVFSIQRVYLKDLSLEQPNSPAAFLLQETPSLDIQLGVGAEPLAEGVFEVTVTATLESKAQDKTVFLIEAKQAAIFEIRHIAPEQMSGVLSVTCPQIIYPYLRTNIADLVQRTGFPPIHLAEINFAAMYEAQQAQNASADAPASPTLQ
jgi:preprotein translocase subunit SecB